MKNLSIATLVLAPAIAFGQDADGLISTIGGWVGALTPIAFACAVLFFFYGLAKFILDQGEGKDAGKSIMIWGVVAIFVMSSIFGLVSFLQSSFDIESTDTISVPSVQGIGGSN